MSELRDILYNNQLNDNDKLALIRQMTQQVQQVQQSSTEEWPVIENWPEPSPMEAKVINLAPALHDDYALGKTPTPIPEPVDYTNGVAGMLRNVANIRRQENNIPSAEAHERGANIIEEYCKKKGGPLENAAEARRQPWIGPRMEAKIAEFLSKGVVADSLKSQPIWTPNRRWHPNPKTQAIYDKITSDGGNSHDEGVVDMYKRWGGQYQVPKPAVHVPFATALAQGANKMNAKHQYKKVLAELTDKTMPSLPIASQTPTTTPVKSDMDHYDREINELIRMMEDGTFYQKVHSPRQVKLDIPGLRKEDLLPQDQTEDESSDEMPPLIDSDGNIVDDSTPVPAPIVSVGPGYEPTWVRYNDNWIKVGGPTYLKFVHGGATHLVTDRHYTATEMKQFRELNRSYDEESSEEEWFQVPKRRARSNSVPPYNCTRETLTESTKYTYYPGTTQLSEVVVVNRETGGYVEMTYFRSGQSQTINTYNCDGDKHGQCREWWPTGQLKSTGEYLNGQFKPGTKSYTYYPSGNTEIIDDHTDTSTFRIEYRDSPEKIKRKQGSLVGGEYEGSVYYFSPIGNIEGIAQFSGGFKNGHSIQYFDTPNQTKRSEVWFQNGQTVSPTVEYDYYGNLIRLDMSTYYPCACPDDHVFKTFKPVQTMGSEIFGRSPQFKKLFDFPETQPGCGVMSMDDVFNQASQIMQSPAFQNTIERMTDTVMNIFAAEKEKTE